MIAVGLRGELRVQKGSNVDKHETKREGRYRLIRVADGRDVLELFDEALGAPERYSEIVVSSPFVDQAGMAILDRLRSSSMSEGQRVRVVVTPSIAAELRSRWSEGVRGFEIVEQPRLHAKVYALVGRRQADSKALITSANLTCGGMARNLEAGVRITGSEQDHLAMIERVASRVAIGDSQQRRAR